MLRSSEGRRIRVIEFKKTNEHTIDSVFLLTLLVMFSATAVLVVFIGARQYQTIANRMESNYETRTAASYLEEKINQNDLAGCVEIASVEGHEAICLLKKANEKTYCTYIYCYDGYLYEITVAASQPVALGDGLQIIPATGFHADYVNSRLICLTLTDTAHTPRLLYVSLNSTP